MDAVFEVRAMNGRTLGYVEGREVHVRRLAARQQAARQPITWRLLEPESLARAVREHERRLDPGELVPQDLMREAYEVHGGIDEAIRLHRVELDGPVTTGGGHRR